MDAKSGTNTKIAKLSVGDKDYTFPIYGGSIGPDVIDVGKLYAQTGMFTFDPGFTSTGACESQDHPTSTATKASCFIAASPSKQLAEHGDFLETCYLLRVRGNADACARRPSFRNYRAHAPHHGARADEAGSSRGSGATRIRWR